MQTEADMMTDPKQVAERLSRQQRDALGHLSEKPWKFPQRWLMLVGYSLEQLGLSKRTWLTDKSYLTPLGLAVRAILTEQQP